MKMRIRSWFVALCVVSMVCAGHGVAAEAHSPTQGAAPTFRSLSRPDPRLYDGFGVSVAQRDRHVLVGAPHATRERDDVGAVFLFTSDGTLVRTWEPPRRMRGSLFGYAVALSSEHVIVGAPRGYDGGGTRTGAVYLWPRRGQAPVKTITNPRPLDGAFGHAIDVRNGTMLVGDPLASGKTQFSAGAAYLFDERTGTLQRRFDASEGGVRHHAQFGHAVVLLDELVIVSAPFADHAARDRGVVMLFDHEGAVVRRIVPPDVQESLLFGYALAASERWLAVGAIGYQSEHREEGIVYLYDLRTATLVRRITNPDPYDRAHFGKTLSMDTNVVAIGMPGERIREDGRIEGGSAYLVDLQRDEIRALNNPSKAVGASDAFGQAISIGEHVFIGAPFAGTGRALDAGLVYQYSLDARADEPGGHAAHR